MVGDPQMHPAKDKAAKGPSHAKSAPQRAVAILRSAIGRLLPTRLRTLLVNSPLARAALAGPEARALNKSRALRAQRHFNASDAAIDAALRENPGSLALAVEHAEIASARGDWEQARIRWQAVLDRFGDTAPFAASLKLARACRKLDKLELAEAAVAVGRAKYPNAIALAVEGSEIAWARRDWPEAAARFQALADSLGEAAPDRVRVKLAHALLFQGKCESARAAIEQATAERGDKPNQRQADRRPPRARGAGSSFTIAIKCPAPSEEVKESWGDYHFAKALAKALAKYGNQVRIDLLPDWYSSGSADDVAIALRGITPYVPASDGINICWLISHPEMAEDRELECYDRVFVASASHAKTLGARLSTAVHPLLQCSDPEVFHPATRAGPAEDLLFVGNTRGTHRKIVSDALAADLPLALYGRGWNAIVPPHIVRGEHIANAELHAHYAAAKIVLNDHWPDMAKNGFVSNRIFDVALSGGFVISDRFVGSELFEGTVVTYATPEELRELCTRWLSDDAGRRELASRLQELALTHTFDQRAAVLHRSLEDISAHRAIENRPLSG